MSSLFISRRFFLLGITVAFCVSLTAACTVGGGDACQADKECRGILRFCIESRCQQCRTTQDCPAPWFCVRSFCTPEDGPRAETPLEATSEKPKDATPERPKDATPEPFSDGLLERPRETLAERLPDGSLPEALPEALPEDIRPEEACNDGQTRPCYSGPPSTEGIGLCKAGTQTCAAKQWSACQGQILPAQENCGDGKDNDCDGLIDPKPDCAKPLAAVSLSFTDFDVMSGGTAAFVQSSLTRMTLACVSPQGTIQSSTVTGGGATALYESIAVVASPTTPLAFLFSYERNLQNGTSDLRLRVLDSACRVTRTLDLATNVASSFHAAASAQGHLAVLFWSGSDLLLRFLKSDGSTDGATLTVVSGTTPCRSSSPVRLAFNTAGAAVVSCQGSSTEGLSFRRLNSSRSWLDPSVLPVVASQGKMTTSGSHLTGINDLGHVAFAWISSADVRAEVTIADPTGKFLPSWLLPPSISSTPTFAGLPHRLLSWDNDFLLRDGGNSSNTPNLWLRINVAGQLVSAASAAFRPIIRRFASSLYLVDWSNRLYLDPIDLSPGKGLCQGQPCFCRPGAVFFCPLPGASSARGLCKQGIAVCQADGSAWSACTGEVLPTFELCGDSKDNDCDGQVDEDCDASQRISAPTIEDIGLHAGGETAALWLSSGRLAVSCLSADQKRSWVTAVSATGRYAQKPLLRYAQDKGFFAVAWFEGSSSSSYGSLKLRTFDSQCSPQSPILSHPSSSSGILLDSFDMAVDPAGTTVAFLYRDPSTATLLLSLYQKDGSAKALHKPFSDRGRDCEESGETFRLALHPTSGEGVISCVRDGSSSLFYQRFSDQGEPLSPQMLTVPGSEQGQSGGSLTHLVGFNRQGRLAFQWFDPLFYRFRAVLFDVSGAPQATLDLGSRAEVEAPLFSPTETLLTVGGDVLFRDGALDASSYPQPHQWFRYSDQGKLLAASPILPTAWLPWTYRRSGASSLILEDRKTILFHPFPLEPSDGLCQGKACLCKPAETRSCYSPSSTPQAPCKAGSQTCAQDGLSWGDCQGEVLPRPEICGNNLDDDCDGQIDENCTGLPPSSPVQNASDIAVGSQGNGALVFIQTVPLASCFTAQGLFQTPSLALTSDVGRYQQARVVATPGGSRFLAYWIRDLSENGSAPVLQARLFDSSCKNLSPVIRLPALLSSTALVDASVSDNGTSAFVFLPRQGNPTLRVYDSGGVLKNESVIDPTGRCGTGSLKVGFHPLGTVGLIACHSTSSTEAVFYRSFDGQGAFSGVLTEIVESRNQYPRSRSLLVRSNASASFAIAWVGLNTRATQAYFLSLLPTETKFVAAVGATGSSSTYAGEQIGLLGDNFVLRESSANLVWHSVAPRTGTIVKSTTAPSPLPNVARETFRVSATQTYLLETISGGRVLRINLFKF